ncbi:MAG TPA: tetratricopeptide repeat protein [Bacteroidales bacterium]|nr:tetratricopeptide repeat protein [Bacteroidales bacterium]HPT21150.1 tetratricopeptide repeat protein [Bacteroidales bacterium]
MKKFRSYFILILAAAVLSSCSGLNKMKKNSNLIKYEVTPKVLEAHAGMVPVTIKGTFPASYFDKKTTVTATPVLVYEGGEVAFDKVQVLQGEKVQANNKVISYNGGDFTYTSSVPYNEKMKVSQLMLRTKATRGSKSLDFDPVKLADGVIATSTLVEKSAKPVIIPDKWQRIVPEVQAADINYVINRSDLQAKELKAEDIALLKEYIKNVNTDPDRKFKNTVISSYASPDGKFELNEKLSKNRGTAADKYIEKEFKKIEAAKAAGFFDNKTTAEDWDGFKSEVEGSSIQDKDLILRVLSMYADPEVREKEIKNMASAFETLKTDILPRLRRSKLMVNVDKIGRSDEQILAQIKSDPKALSVDEILYAATLTKDANEQLSYYKIATEVYPKSVSAHNNLGCAYLESGKTDDAVASFEKAKAIENNDVVKNNLGFASIVKGDFAKAEEYFTSMTSSSPESKFGLGTIAITKGEYDKAVNFFGTEPSCNLALAQLLKGDTNKAKTTLEALKPCKCGKPSYLKAIVGARLDDRNYMLNNLREAIGFNADWKAYAKTDVEFAKYFSDDTFKSTVQ